MKAVAVLLTLLAGQLLTGCGNVPGADGRYATHDRGNGTVDPTALNYFSGQRSHY